MNMTSEETIQDIPATASAPVTADPQRIYKLKQRMDHLQEDPEFVRMMKNRRRVQEECEAFKALPPEQRSRIMFAGQCHLMTKWREKEKAERNRRERE